ncbi:translation initiation factor IF-2 N-terminal domain-containing protein [Rhodococcus antarcticus]|uniref:Translation initiation factor IF-2 N-terminal domain-containing protein n=1 Tax=Rhodococcus antarcticus TaxID=2987751 RepID=A0ABY6NWP6_9NOCA|nr:translation initiation factor IF-2 N-terminal domain-containing protein [Rhodococcus antarcticus]UZJ23806.1 translation initiation factor IF-2 N-terminal domain-containing protein [Rhodococcus antarcticus]
MAQIVPPENTDLPTRLRVHALAKLLGVTSKAVLVELERLGSAVGSAQSSIDRAVAEQVRAALAPAAASPAPEPAAEPEPTAPPTAAAPAVQAPLFMAPEPVAAPPRRRRASRPAAPAEADVPTEVTDAAPAEPAAAQAPVAPAAETPEADQSPPSSGRGRRRRTSKPADAEGDAPTTGTPAAASEEPSDPDAQDHDQSDDSLDEDGQPKRRRRGRRGRGRGRGPSADEQNDEGSESTGSEPQRDGDQAVPPAAEDTSDDADERDDDAEDSSDEDGGNGRRRRRRRRRRSSGESAEGETQTDDDPPNTVVHEREPRARRSRGGRGESRDKGDAVREGSDEVQGITGSTRLEAKRQRRRDGRDVGRRRPPILSESEFLARREAVDRKMVVRQHGQQTQVAVLEDDVLVEHFVTSASSTAMVGNIYVGRVQNVLPSMEAAFLDVGRGRNGVLYAGEVDWDAAGLGGRSRKIEQALHSGDPVLVQVSKDPVGHKGARLTTQISLPGRFLVYVPGGGSTGISRKLPDTERKRLKDILKRIVPAEAGVIIRTASEGVSEEELAKDVERLQAQWEDISAKAAAATAGGAKFTAPVALHEEPDLLVKVVRDLFNEDFSSLVVAGEDAWGTVERYVSSVAVDLLPRVQRWTEDTDVFAAHRIDEQLAKAMDRKVWLPSGGTLVIDRTEAMTVVDVNTGKFTGAGGNLEETVTRNNIEAAEEIVRQMRLRDIGGMIVVDFIDMVLESNRDLVLRRLTECLGRDRTRHQVSEVTSLGLVQMTRKRMGAGLIEEFSVPCEHCHGRGVIVQAEPVVQSSTGGARAESAGTGRDRRHDRPATAAPVVLDPGPLVRSTPPVPGPKGRPVSAPAPVTSAAEETAAEVSETSTTVAESTPEPAVATPEPAPARRSRARRASRPASAPTDGDAVAGEPVVVEPVVAEPAAVEPAAPVEPVVDELVVPVVEPVEDAPVVAPPARRSRARRTASRPEAAPESGTAPVVVAVAVPESPAVDPAVVTVLPEAAAPPVEQPAVTRPRRRRAAGRPAGPPVGESA